MVADQVQHARPGPSGKAPQGLADRRRRRAVQDLGHPVLGEPATEQVEDVAAEGEQHLAGWRRRESSSSHSSAVAAKSSLGPVSVRCRSET